MCCRSFLVRISYLLEIVEDTDCEVLAAEVSDNTVVVHSLDCVVSRSKSYESEMSHEAEILVDGECDTGFDTQLDDAVGLFLANFVRMAGECKASIEEEFEGCLVSECPTDIGIEGDGVEPVLLLLESYDCTNCEFVVKVVSYFGSKDDTTVITAPEGDSTTGIELSVSGYCHERCCNDCKKLFHNRSYN